MSTSEQLSSINYTTHRGKRQKDPHQQHQAHER